MSATPLDWLRTLVTSQASSTALTLDERRAAMDSYPQPLPEGTVVQLANAGGAPAEWLRRHDSTPGRVILYLHGGGYEIGSIRSCRRLASLVGAAAGADCLTVDYRLAPEHPCPAAVDDAVGAYRWLVERGTPSGGIVLVGESAGGGLAVATLLALKEAGDPLPAGAAVIAPWIDLALTGDSIRSRAGIDFMLTEASLRDAASGYAALLPLDDPLVSPLYGDLDGLPALLVHVGDADLLFDDSVRLAERAKAAGVDATLDVWPDMPHVFHAFAGLLDEADDAIARIGAWARRVALP